MAGRTINCLCYVGVILPAICVICTFIMHTFGRGLCLLNKTDSCYSTYRYFGTKTSYSVVLDIPNNSDGYYIKGCVPQLFYLFSRHATRYPDDEDIESMNHRLPFLKQKIITAFNNGQSKLCESVVSNLKHWLFTMTLSDNNRISLSGKHEAENLAIRLRQRYPSLLGREYSSKNYMFGITSRSRTRSTAEAFAIGLFGHEVAQEVEFETQDEILQFHKKCKVIQKKCNISDEVPSEIKRFENVYLRRLVPTSVSERLGFNVSLDDIEVMYDICRFEFALEYYSPWCAIFSDDNLKLLEYWNDLDDYYKDGYGYEKNYLQACPVIRYLTEHLRTAINSNSYGAMLHFSHAGAIKKVFSHLGLFRDNSPLTADGFLTPGHKWRPSLMCPFNANINFLLMKCPNDHSIVTFVNEKIVRLKGCNNIVCSVDTFFKMYAQTAFDCDLNKICCCTNKL